MNLKELEKSIEVDDNMIMLLEPLRLKKYGKVIEVKQVNWYYEWNNFIYYLGNLLHYYYTICQGAELPDKLNEMETFRKNMRLTINNTQMGKQAFKSLMKLCNFIKINTRFPKRWMKKYFTLDDYIEILIYLYLYNIKGLKKNLKNALKITGVHIYN